jgi:phenylpropionate dioxygenase-like ring-hydroxylating dioxygenase large terminal subunit
MENAPMTTEETSDVPVCPGAPTFQEIMRSDGGPVCEVLTRQSNPPQSRADIPFSRYTSQAFFDLEMEKMWRKVWQYVCREDEVADPGDYKVYDIGRHSLVVVRADDGSLRAYHNSCLHRGTKLKDSRTSGWSGELRCRYHGWTWDLDGALKEVPCAWEFPHLDYAANRLPRARAEAWNGLVFVNLDRDAPPLLDYLGVLPEHFSNWPWTDWYLFMHLEKELHCNWKTAQDAFMEAYHTPLVHPQLTQVVGDWNMQHDIFDDHVSRDLCAFAVCSPAAKTSISEQKRLDRVLTGGRSPDATSVTLAAGQSARDAMARQVRGTLESQYGMDTSGYSDAEMIDSIKYNLFPNIFLYTGLSSRAIHRVKPIANDPNRCTFEVLMMRPVAKGQPRPAPAEVVRIPEEMSYRDVKELAAFALTAITLDQDTGNLRAQHEGMLASVKGAETLSIYQESRIRAFHDTLEKYLNA